MQAESLQSEVRPLPTDPNGPAVTHGSPLEQESETGPEPGAAPAPAAPPEHAVAKLSSTEHRKIFWEALSAGAIGKVIGTGFVKFLEKVL
ncbi:hypothetical protein IU436_30255 [Nocardia farcinica]|uniref:hypothetical protein n=1 Tax=Nocardia farcinica TaxID=37329 RepID=UPI0018932B46|nr:hypothetical protein [Nocardia farcinica]MBF6422516.1 hypothetical protein [Nocardia farcinica]MBF6434598.1 hypothetical protein [Nocardia farcinica]MBF6505695.1 hypothetical protein [Nocardia farcinica]